jgi:hypothetical protein
LLLESRRSDLNAERGILDNINVTHRTNTNNSNSTTNTNTTNGNQNTNTATTNTNSTNSNTNSASEADIQVTAPVSGATVSSPLTLTGKAREFENVFNYRITDARGNILAEDHVLYSAPDTGVFGNFNLQIDFDDPETTTGTVEVFAKSARDGSEIDMVTIPVTFE